MIILDTNIISEVMSTAASPAVVDWLNNQDTATLYLTTITLAEIRYGLRILPQGKRRILLEKKFEQFIENTFLLRILVFDEAAARIYGEIMGHRRELGRPMSSLDGQIASIARAHKYALATRNVRDFEHCGLLLINPFDPKSINGRIVL